MPRIRLLRPATSPVVGRAGDVLDVDGPTASELADGIRAEMVREEQPEQAVNRAPEQAGGNHGPAGE